MSVISAAGELLTTAITRRIFPAAVVDVGSSDGPLWREAFGTLTFDADAPPTREDTPFDLASLTKVVVTTTAVMDLIASGSIELDERVAGQFSDWRGADREPVTVRDLLEHASGLPARLLDPPPSTGREFTHDISVMPLEYPPRTRSVYSDLGFILLGILVSVRAGRTLAEHFDSIRGRLARADPTLRTEPLTFTLEDRDVAAPTLPMDDDERRGRTLAGTVHDNYAAVLGPVAGHAGLFGTAGALAAFARIVLRAARGESGLPEPFTPGRVAQFLTKSAVPGSSRALGWDTMLPTSSCGSHMSPRAIGHVGFTGTSLWIDPARDRYFVLLTNRAYQGGTVDEMREVRRAFHDSLARL